MMNIQRVIREKQGVQFFAGNCSALPDDLGLWLYTLENSVLTFYTKYIFQKALFTALRFTYCPLLLSIIIKSWHRYGLQQNDTNLKTELATFGRLSVI